MKKNLKKKNNNKLNTGVNIIDRFLIILKLLKLDKLTLYLCNKKNTSYIGL